jgi:hypothetical protein
VDPGRPWRGTEAPGREYGGSAAPSGEIHGGGRGVVEGCGGGRRRSERERQNPRALMQRGGWQRERGRAEGAGNAAERGTCGGRLGIGWSCGGGRWSVGDAAARCDMDGPDRWTAERQNGRTREADYYCLLNK